MCRPRETTVFQRACTCFFSRKYWRGAESHRIKIRCFVQRQKAPRQTFLRGGTRSGIWRSGPYGLRLLIFPQPLGRALKNQNAAPTTPPCFGRRPRSSSLLFESHWVPRQIKNPPMQSISTAFALVDIPTGWDPRTNQQPTGLLIALPSAVPCCSRPTGHPPNKKNPPMQSISGFFGGVPSGTRTHGLQIHNLAR